MNRISLRIYPELHEALRKVDPDSRVSILHHNLSTRFGGRNMSYEVFVNTFVRVISEFFENSGFSQLDKRAFENLIPAYIHALVQNEQQAEVCIGIYEAMMYPEAE